MTEQRIYLDYNASTPVAPAVAAAMRPFLEDDYGNPSSGHWAATKAKAALEGARGQVAALLGCHDDEVVFTSGGSEVNNLALNGAFFALRDRGDHIIISALPSGAHDSAPGFRIASANRYDSLSGAEGGMAKTPFSLNPQGGSNG